MFQCFNVYLLVNFYYKIKQHIPPPPTFVKVTEVIQNKKKIFQCFAQWFALLIFQSRYGTDL